MIVVTNASIKNQVAISIAHIHNNNNLVIKTIHHVVNVMSTKTKLFTIICSINQATHLSLMNSENSSREAITISLSFGTAQVIKDSILTI